MNSNNDIMPQKQPKTYVVLKVKVRLITVKYNLVISVIMQVQVELKFWILRQYSKT